MPKITIQDIATRAGVAKSTVSRFLNGGSVSAKTRTKIEAIVDAAGYQPNVFAQSLKQQTTRTIGVIVPRLDSYAQTEMLHGLDDANQDDVFLIMNTYQVEATVQKAIQQVETLRLSGLIIFAANLSDATKKMIAELDVPVVIQGQDMPEFSRVVVDDGLAGAQIGQLAANAARVLMISVDPLKDFEIGQIRYQATRFQLTGVVDTVYADFSLNSAKQLTAEALATNHYDAIIAMTDLMAAGALQSLLADHGRVPEETKVLGFGGTLISDLAAPNITTFAFDYYRVGQEIYELFKEQQTNPEVKSVRVGGKLVIKQTSW